VTAMIPRTTVEARTPDRSAPPRARNTRRRLWTAMSYAILVPGALLFVAPFAWLVSASFQHIGDIFSWPPQWIPKNPTLDGYKGFFGIGKVGRQAQGSEGAWRWFVNSAFVATSITVLQLFFNSLAAYTFAKRRFPGRDIIFVLFLATMMVPPQVTLIPNYLVLKHVPFFGGNDALGHGGHGWLDSYWGLILPGTVSAFGIFLLRQYMMSIPDELLDATPVDGAGEFRVFWLRPVRGEEPNVLEPAHGGLGGRHSPDDRHVPAVPAALHPGHLHDGPEGVTGSAAHDRAHRSGLVKLGTLCRGVGHHQHPIGLQVEGKVGGDAAHGRRRGDGDCQAAGVDVLHEHEGIAADRRGVVTDLHRHHAVPGQTVAEPGCQHTSSGAWSSRLVGSVDDNQFVARCQFRQPGHDRRRTQPGIALVDDRNRHRRGTGLRLEPQGEPEPDMQTMRSYVERRGEQRGGQQGPCGGGGRAQAVHNGPQQRR
jgi:ABC-type glycerol-3-phosphate transport system permease component